MDAETRKEIEELLEDSLLNLREVQVEEEGECSMPWPIIEKLEKALFMLAEEGVKRDVGL